MNARELRIGNLVECKVFGDTYTDRFPHYGKNVFPVFSACKDFVKIDIGFDALRKVEIHEVKPIPLTDKWLIDFGFVPFVMDTYYLSVMKQEDPYVHTFKKNELVITKLSFPNIPHWYEFQYQSSEVNRYNALKLNFVHQLQNLFFDLTGEELTIKTE